MIRVFALAVGTLMLAACVDRGECLATETVHHDGYFYTTVVTYDGTNMVPQVNYMPPSDETVCTKWEFPEGRPQ